MKQLALSCTEIFDHLVEIEKLAVYTNILGHGEPQLGKYDLYPSVNSKETRESYSHDGMVDGKRMHNTLMTLLCHSDGKHSTTDVAKLLGEGVDFVDKVAAILRDKKIIKEI